MNCVDHAIYDMKRNIPVVFSCNSPVWSMRLTLGSLHVNRCEIHCMLDGDTVDITIVTCGTKSIHVSVSLPLTAFITFADEPIATPTAVILYDNDNFRSTHLPPELSLRL